MAGRERLHAPCTTHPATTPTSHDKWAPQAPPPARAPKLRAASSHFHTGPDDSGARGYHTSGMTKQEFGIVSSEDMAEHTHEDRYANVDLVCALCDNGAVKAVSEVMKVFKCKNCEYGKYQCFACGRLGSAKTNPPEVFPCASSTCGHFYHAKCVAQLLFPENRAKATEYTAMIASGGPKFACPLHKCGICKYRENKEDKELQFAVCRRCPKSYHRRCLPRMLITLHWKKVEESVEVVKDALHMLEYGASIADAKSVCPPHVLFQLVKWKNKLNVFLAPFLHGMRYTSYGRHFTKLDKLQLVGATISP
ncbi:unnamed protein product [Miscanthus lutarioriparius]|uniref:Histone-lysine N-methyltransferase NSD-like PHD zinc finger domain-containing protein n=1 Tax=Miscanthus lutarioriparius TaxID=422564 RepID=A0A811PK65_9POAL|nr:unnamed protein product [Miscanthus lutarioriparius]